MPLSEKEAGDFIAMVLVLAAVGFVGLLILAGIVKAVRWFRK